MLPLRCGGTGCGTAAAAGRTWPFWPNCACPEAAVRSRPFEGGAPSRSRSRSGRSPRSERSGRSARTRSPRCSRSRGGRSRRGRCPGGAISLPFDGTGGATVGPKLIGSGSGANIAGAVSTTGSIVATGADTISNASAMGDSGGSTGFFLVRVRGFGAGFVVSSTVATSSFCSDKGIPPGINVGTDGEGAPLVQTRRRWQSWGLSQLQHVVWGQRGVKRPGRLATTDNFASFDDKAATHWAH